MVAIMSSKMSTGIQNLFSIAARERCITNMKQMKTPTQWKGTIPEAAVLLPMCRINDNASLLYTVRASTLRNHGGQISFPGGKINDGETPVQAALRETQEEIGLDQSKIDVWGTGKAVPGRNNNIKIIPVIGALLDLKKEDLKLNFQEVSEVFAVPIEKLCDPQNQYYTQYKNGFILPVFLADDYKIWGITAYLTHAFLSSLLPKDIYRNDWCKKKVEIKANELKEQL